MADVQIPYTYLPSRPASSPSTLQSSLPDAKTSRWHHSTATPAIPSPAWSRPRTWSLPHPASSMGGHVVRRHQSLLENTVEATNYQSRWHSSLTQEDQKGHNILWMKAIAKTPWIWWQIPDAAQHIGQSQAGCRRPMSPLSASHQARKRLERGSSNNLFSSEQFAQPGYI